MLHECKQQAENKLPRFAVAKLLRQMMLLSHVTVARISKSLLPHESSLSCRCRGRDRPWNTAGTYFSHHTQLYLLWTETQILRLSELMEDKGFVKDSQHIDCIYAAFNRPFWRQFEGISGLLPAVLDASSL